ncbi:MAG TPA: M20/M25/M40 family metallo-hydrolase [Allosphingosinicella sp.]|nr:M20/M25/M40 family metallo-hydrolase [Allosphingosinicella sp.]
MKRTGLIVALLMLALLAMMGAKSAMVPIPAPAGVQAGGFHTARALARLQRILGDQRPHPVDSAANDGVRSRLVAELRALGLSPRIADSFTCNGAAAAQTVSCARIRNVVATIGPAQGRHVLLVSHYDSTPTGPGASDDGIGIASMLEVAALLKDRPLRRPVTFLFNEGEETGLIGARAFLAGDPLAARVDSLVNLESRGTTGPAIMFETSRPNGRAIGHYARSVTGPAANSLTTDFSRLIPNQTDVAVLKERPWTILNFAIIGNETRYHSPDDTIANLDPRSLRHMGEQALQVTADLAGGRPAPAGGERLYGDVLGIGLITLPLWLGLALLGALLLGFVRLAWSRRAGVARGSAALALAMADAALTAFLLHGLIGWLRPGEYWRAHPEWISLAIDATAMASAAVTLLWIAGPVARERLRLAYWLGFLVLGAVLCLVAPGAAIYFLLPPLLAGAGLLWPRVERFATGLALLTLVIHWLPLLHLSQVLLDFDAGWVFAPVSVLILFPFLIELKPAMAPLGRGRVTAVLAAAAALAWLPAAFAPAYSIERKQRLSLEYVWDQARGEARWMAYHDRGRLPAAMHALGKVERGVEVPWSSYRRWAVDARGPAVAPPALERIGERAVGGNRLLSFRLRMRGSDVVRLVGPKGARFLAVGAGGSPRRFGKDDGKEAPVLRCHGRSCDGLQMVLLIAGTEPIEVVVVGTRSGLPPAGAVLVRGRPGTAQPQYVPDTTVAIGRVRL